MIVDTDQGNVCSGKLRVELHECIQGNHIQACPVLKLKDSAQAIDISLVIMTELSPHYLCDYNH